MDLFLDSMIRLGFDVNKNLVWRNTIPKEPEKSALGLWPSPKADFSGSLGIGAQTGTQL